MGDFSAEPIIWGLFGKVITVRYKNGVKWASLFTASEQHLSKLEVPQIFEEILYRILQQLYEITEVRHFDGGKLSIRS